MTMNSSLTSREMTNGTEYLYDTEGSQFYVITRRLQTVLLPFVCAVGLVGNSLAIRTFLSAGLRSSSCSLYLTAKCLSDNGFLLTLALVWLYRMHVPLFTLQGICQITIFLSYSCGFLSVWFVAVITCENYVRIAHTARVPSCCTAPRALFIIALFTFAAAALNSVHLWITAVVHEGGHARCVSLTSRQDLLVAMTYADTVLTLLLPLLCIFLMVIVISHHVLRAQRRRQRLKAGGSQRAHGIKRQQTPQVKMTRFLLAISLIFLVLHTPSHAIRIKMVVCLFVFHQQPTSADRIFQNVFELLFFLNFCNNFLIYVVFGDNFRRTFKSICQRPFIKRAPRGLSAAFSMKKYGPVQSDVTELVAV